MTSLQQYRARQYRTQGLVLKNVPFGEADLLVTVFSRETGKLKVVAKGARRSNSRMVGHFEPLTVTKLALSRGRNLDIVNQVEVSHNFAPLRNDLTLLTKGLYVLELVDGFGSEASPNQPLYDLSLEVLNALVENPNPDLVLRYFELRLLQVSGFMPELFLCVECRQPLEPEQHRFSPDAGGTLCLNCAPPGAHVRPLSLRALKILRLMHRNRIDQLPQLQINDALEQEVKSLLGSAIDYWIDKEIRSNSFLKQLEHWSKSRVSSKAASRTQQSED